MPRRTWLLALLPLAVAACGLTKSASTTAPASTSTSTSTSTEAAPTTTVAAYFLRDGKVAPVPVEVPHTLAVATAALDALFAGPPDGYESALPAGTRLVSLRLENGVATATLSPEARELTTGAEAQIVYTLTRFPSVTGVGLRLPDAPLPIRDDHGEALDTFATRGDFEQETPRILVDEPLAGATVTSPVHVAGTSNLFEASSIVELVQDGRTIAQKVVTASAGNGERGSFAVDVPYTARGAATIVSYDRNAADGSIENRVEIPVTLS